MLVARVYQLCWWACWGPVVAVTTVAGLVLGSLFEAVALGIFAATFAALTTSLFREHAPLGATSSVAAVRVLSTTPPGWAASCAAVGAAVLVASAVALGATVWPLTLVAALTSPPVVSAWVGCGRGLRRAERGVCAGGCSCGCGDAVRAEDLAGLVQGLTGAELRLAWRESWAQLHCAPTPEATHGVVRVREAYLAEFERRDPHATHVWLATLARTPLTDPEQWLPHTFEDGAP